jgi:hypothetical protein
MATITTTPAQLVDTLRGARETLSREGNTLARFMSVEERFSMLAELLAAALDERVSVRLRLKLAEAIAGRLE